MLLACNKKSIRKNFFNKQDLSDYVFDESNGFVKNKSFKNIKFEMTFLPKKLIYLKNDASLTNNQLDSLTKIENNTYYFRYRIYGNDGQSPIYYVSDDYQGYLQLNDYFGYSFHKKVILKTKKFQKKASHVYFISDYGLVPYLDFLLVFDNIKDINDEIIISINDEVFGYGILNFYFDKEIVNSKIKLNS
ncbi:MAG TPA: hypothetical protein DIU39_08015 [Flavobacteriales bacterium]|jgi:hypothetical protein|nr:hypothetical protein [Flavobacteriales bacterium]